MRIEHHARHANNPNVGRFLSPDFPSPYTVKDAEEFLGRHERDTDEFHRVIVVGKEAVGCIGIVCSMESGELEAEIGLWIGEEFWGRGIGTKAVVEMTRTFREHFSNIPLKAWIVKENTVSRRVFQSAGFVETENLTERWNEKIMEMVKLKLQIEC